MPKLTLDDELEDILVFLMQKMKAKSRAEVVRRLLVKEYEKYIRPLEVTV